LQSSYWQKTNVSFAFAANSGHFHGFMTIRTCKSSCYPVARNNPLFAAKGSLCRSAKSDE
jgi:hypothetical protein